MTKNTNKWIGRRFGRLTVVSCDETIPPKYYVYFNCVCDCGNEININKDVVLRKMRNNKLISCGCSHKKAGIGNKGKQYPKQALSKIGEKFNRLTIIDIKRKDKIKRYFHITKCDCGNITKNIYADLVSSKVMSCGCYGKEQQSKTGSKVGLNNGTINCSKRKWGINKNGKFIRMRSGFEVMYAMILDKENIEWEYEPKLFKLKDGVRYTPDFYLKEQDLWIDVKGQLTEKHRMKHKLFKELGCNFKLVFMKEIQERLGYSYHIFKKQWDIKVESDNVEIPRKVVTSTK